MSSSPESPDPSAELKVSRVNRAVVGFIARRPGVALLLGLLIVGALVPGMGKLEADFTHRGFFWEQDPKIKAFDAFERRFGNDDMVSLTVHSPSGIFDLESAALLRELTTKMWQIPEVIRVDSLSNFSWVHGKDDDIVIEPLLPEELTPQLLAERKAIALGHETLPNYLVSKDGNTAVVNARIRPAFEQGARPQAITVATRKLVAELTRGDHTIRIGGGPPMTYAFEEVSQGDVARLAPMAIGIAAVFLAFLLRSASAIALSILIVILSTMGVFGLAGHLGMVQTAMSTAVPTILIAVGIADTVHVLILFFAALGRGMERRQAARYTLTKNFLPTFLTSLTTAVGFWSFVSANLKPLSTMGIMAGCGTILAWILTQLIIGGALFLIPFKAKRVTEQQVKRTERRAGALIDLIARRRWIVIGITAVLSGAALTYSLGVEVNSDPVKYFRKGTPMREAFEFVEEHLGGGRAFELVVDAGREEGVKDPAFLAKVEALSRWLEAQPGITRAISVVDVLKSTHRALHANKQEEYRIAGTQDEVAQELLLYTMGLPQGMDVNDQVSVKYDALRMTVINTLKMSREAVAQVHATEAKAKELGLSVHGTGKYFLYQDTNDYVVDSFLTSLWSANLVIGLIMVFFLRSVRLGIISMIPNIVPLFAGGALLRFIGQPLDMGTVLVASITLGISIDDTSHLLSNYVYMRRQGMDAVESLKEVMAHSGPALLSTNGILITAFASFATATFMPNVFMGILTAFILTMALAADMFFTPALLLVGVGGKSARRVGSAPLVDARAAE
jgi:hypothetical protein